MNANLDLSEATKLKLGGPMNIFMETDTSAVRVLVVGVPNENGDVRLRIDIKGTLQLSPGWMAHLVELLSYNEQVLVTQSLVLRSILTGVSMFDRTTGKLIFLWVEVDDDGSIRVLD